jgi:hypothetical protein
MSGPATPKPGTRPSSLEMEQIADKVYRLLLKDMRLSKLRGETTGLPKPRRK